MKKILLLIIASLGILNVSAQETRKQITLDNIFKEYRFYVFEPDDIKSTKDGEHYTELYAYTTIYKRSYKTGQQVATLFSSASGENNIGHISDYQLNADETKILLEANAEPIYRHSYVADFYVYDIKSDKLTKVFDEGKIQLATFSPNGKSIAFTWENDLYIKDIITNKIVKVTDDGKYNEIINGRPDWVYEEEFGFNKAFDWSPDGKNLAYMKFNETNVKLYGMSFYGDLYPEYFTFKYPKAGEENSVVSIHVFNLESGETYEVNMGEEKDIYFPRIQWTKDNNLLSIVKLNRLQNHVEVILANVTTKETRLLYEEKEDAYISEITDDYITFMPDNMHFVIKSERDGYTHLYRYNMDGTFQNQVTEGNWDLIDVLGVSEDGKVYYTAFDESPLYTAVYSVTQDGKEKHKWSSEKGTNKALFSEGFKYYLLFHSTANNPLVVSLYDNKQNLIRTIDDNEHVKNAMQTFGFSEKEFFTFTTSENIELHGFMIKPPDFEENKKHPVFMYVYGGPEYQCVNDEISFYDGWFQYLAQKGYIVACIDGRGSGGKGEDFRKCIYMNLGKYETLDQIEAAKYLGTLPYVDNERIGIFGWSYGGYLSLLCLTRASDLFKMAIAVAPITNWRFYDTIYTERYMRTPQENPKGYDDNSPINYVEKMKGKLLLIHGMADDNVHLQNSTEFVEKMVQADKQFTMQFYPNKNHSIYGGNTRMHLFKCMSEFVLENL
ncbi:MAG: S9 family peptidase [Bacteroidales bacterium]|nr:S9 family peptidase [Bacteroidales bacterium]